MVTVTAVTLVNFRGFSHLNELRLAPLTFLVGPNSSGKSSIADALLFMAQSGFLSLAATNPIWSGSLVDLGSFKDTVFRHEMRRAIEIGVELDGVPLPPKPGPGRPRRESTRAIISAQINTAKGAPEGRLKWLDISDPEADSASLQRRAGRYESFRVYAAGQERDYDPRQPWQSPIEALGALLRGRRRTVPRLARLLAGDGLNDIAATVQRVSSGRNPPQRSYERDGGSAGERARPLLDGIDATALEEGRQPNSKRLRSALIDGLEALRIADHLDVTRLSDYHTAVRLRDNLTGVLSNVADFGYGASQVIPVLEGCAAPGPGPLFIEQPEIHLHPRAQGEVAQILCDASRRRQMIVETHSEHMINRARRLVAEGKMKAQDVIIQYIDRNAEGSNALTIELDDAGDFTADWPDGFFDERYRETMQIAKAQAKRAAE